MSPLANVVCRRGGSLLTTLHKSLATYQKCGILCYGGGPGAGFSRRPRDSLSPAVVTCDWLVRAAFFATTKTAFSTKVTDG